MLKFIHLPLSICTFFERIFHKIFWTLLGYTVAKAPTSKKFDLVHQTFSPCERVGSGDESSLSSSHKTMLLLGLEGGAFPGSSQLFLHLLSHLRSWWEVHLTWKRTFRSGSQVWSCCCWSFCPTCRKSYRCVDVTVCGCDSVWVWQCVCVTVCGCDSVDVTVCVCDNVWVDIVCVWQCVCDIVCVTMCGCDSVLGVSLLQDIHKVQVLIKCSMQKWKGNARSILSYGWCQCRQKKMGEGPRSNERSSSSWTMNDDWRRPGNEATFMSVVCVLMLFWHYVPVSVLVC